MGNKSTLEEYRRKRLQLASVSRRGRLTTSEIFLHSLHLNLPAQLTATLKEENVNEKKEADDFHDSDAEDVYDLFNAVNGELHNGLLDVRKLNELSVEESEILNVPRLREIWAHTANGCTKCKEIVLTLNAVRNLLREDTNASSTEEIKAAAWDRRE